MGTTTTTHYPLVLLSARSRWCWMKARFIGAIDAGTTSVRFIIFDEAGKPQVNVQYEFEQIYPHSG